MAFARLNQWFEQCDRSSTINASQKRPYSDEENQSTKKNRFKQIRISFLFSRHQ